MPRKKAKPVTLAVLSDTTNVVATKTVRKKVTSKRVSPSTVSKRSITTRTKKQKVSKETIHIPVTDETPTSDKIAIVRNQFQLALLSPFRFPIDNNHLVSNVARYAGVFFVIVGAVFTLLNMQYAQGTFTGKFGLNQSALTGSSIPTTATVVDPKPKIDVVIDGALPYANVTPVNVYVPYATDVSVYAKNVTESTKVVLGQAHMVSEGLWRLYWDTRQYNDGEYRIGVAVVNEFGSYEQSNFNAAFIENHPIQPATPVALTTNAPSTTVPSATGTTSTQTPSQPTTTASVPVNLVINEATPLSGSVRAQVFVHDAPQVKLSIRRKSDTSFTNLGYPTYHGNDEWRFEWDTKQFPDGDYVLKSQAIFTNTTYQSNALSIEINNGVSPSTTPASVSTSTVNQETLTTLEPNVDIRIPKSGLLTNDTDILLSVTGAQSIELYAVPKNSLTPYYLGLAQKQNATEWKFKWMTRQTPNGEYGVFAKVKQTYGITESKKISAVVQNPIETTPTLEQQQAIDALKNVKNILDDTTVDSEQLQKNIVRNATSSNGEAIIPVHLTSVTSVLDELHTDDAKKAEIENILTSFKKKIALDLYRYSMAVRNNDEDEMISARERIESTRKSIIDTLPLSKEQSDMITLIDAHLKQIVSELEELTIRDEKIIKERVGESALRDSDKDGITDYDEVNLYNTNPYVADTDGDSYIDGTEVMAGFDPNDSTPQTLVQYESPIDVGVVHDEIFVVKNIISLDSSEKQENSGETQVSAIISGMGLPNSFVTLYVYSTPIVVTIKTDDSGSWSYIFDKELEDGTHKMYVGITDNAGRIVAKSNPFSFVKTAQAFTPVDATADSLSSTETVAPSLVSQSSMLVVASIAIVALGLVLILLGFHIRPTRKPDELATI